MESKQLRVVIYPEANRYVAQCLEYDIVASGETLSEVTRVLEATIQAELAECERRGISLEALGKAPDRFHGMWEHAFESLASPTIGGMEVALRAA